jgi:hypothetical protein
VGEDAAELLVSTSSHSIDIPPLKNNVLSDIYTHEVSNSIFSNSPSSTDDFDENEKFANFVRKVDSPENANEDISEPMCESVDDQITDTRDELTLPLDNDAERMQESQDATPENRFGNSLLSGQNSWTEPATVASGSSRDVEEESAEGAGAATEIVFSRQKSTRSGSIDNVSFESLLEEKMRRNTVNFKAVWERFHKSTANKSNRDIPEEGSPPEGFEFIKQPLMNKKEAEELEQMVEILCRLSTEAGLDQQGFLCKGCKSPLVDISKATVCGFDGCYYCSTCISKDKYAIPAKIIFNWDFTQYSVSKRAADFISDYQFKPFIDFKVSPNLNVCFNNLR